MSRLISIFSTHKKLLSFLFIILLILNNTNNTEDTKTDNFDNHTHSNTHDKHKGRKCGFSQVQHRLRKPRPISIQTDSDSKRFLQLTNPQKIRIHVDYGTLDSQVSSYSQEKIDNVKAIVKESINFFEKILMVQRLVRKLSIPEPCDALVTKTSPDLLNKDIGVDADLVIFPVFDATAGNSLEAYASSCFLNTGNFRPIAGIIGFSPVNINTKFTNWLNYYNVLVIHEMTHIFVFNSALFKYFKDSTGNAITVTKDKVINGLKRTLIVTPKVVKEARAHFGCATLEGIELENQGGDATAGSHWEMRTMLGDYMVGESYNEVTLSRISLALFEDSGWYKVNYYTGGLFKFGLLEGCSFGETDCLTDQKTNFPNAFCSYPRNPMCYAGYGMKGHCVVSEFSSLPSSYRYFQNPKWGGHHLADYCPIAESITDFGDYFFGNSCYEGKKNMLPSAIGEFIGDSSKCFISSLTPKANATVLDLKGKDSAVCFKAECDTATNSIKITIKDKSILCPEQGGEMALDGYDGRIICPPYYLFCTSTVPCNDMIDCVNKKSMKTITAKSGKSPVELAAANTMTTPMTANNSGGTTDTTTATSNSGTDSTDTNKQTNTNNSAVNVETMNNAGTTGNADNTPSESTIEQNSQNTQVNSSSNADKLMVINGLLVLISLLI